MPRRPPHLLVAISPHGFGHAAQTAPVVNALRMRVPELRVTLRTTVSRELLAARFAPPWDAVSVASDFGMVMGSAIDVQVGASAAAYARLHARWAAAVAEEAAALRTIGPDLILANIPYLTLAGARMAGIPAIALCSLNWADIYHHYCASRPEASSIHAQMLDAYRAARQFIRPEPGMPMSDLPAVQPVGPIALVGSDRRHDIRRALGTSPDTKLVVVAPGGMPLAIPIEQWPRIPNVRWLMATRWEGGHPDAVSVADFGLPFVDILRSCDALIGKPGYGTFVEAACNGTPVIYVARGDWPEEPYLTDWLNRYGRTVEIDVRSLLRGDLKDPLSALWALPPLEPVKPTGVDQAADLIARELGPRLSS